MIQLLRQRDFALLFWGGLISMTGDWMMRIALAVFVYELTGSTLATGVMFMAASLPTLLLGSVAGVFVDRWDRKRTMVVANLLMMLGLLPLALVQSAEWLWLIYAVAFWQSCVSQFFGPAENALLPQLVGEEKLVTANSLNQLNNNLARLLGPAIGGVLVLSLGLSGIALIDAFSFLIAAVMIALISAPARAPRPETHDAAAPGGWGSVWREWRAGLALVRKSRLLRVLFSIIALWALGEGIIGVLFVPFVKDVLKGQAPEVGYLMSAQAIGGLLGGVVIARFGERLSPARMLAICSFSFGLIDLVIFNYSYFFPGFLIAVLLFVLVGIPSAGAFASLLTLIQQHVSDEYRGRVFGAFTTTFGLVTLVGMAFASTLGEVLGVGLVINVQGIVFVLGGLVAWMGISSQRNSASEPLPGEPEAAA